MTSVSLTLLHSELAKLHRVLAVLSAIGLQSAYCLLCYWILCISYFMGTVLVVLVMLAVNVHCSVFTDTVYCDLLTVHCFLSTVP